MYRHVPTRLVITPGAQKGTVEGGVGDKQATEILQHLHCTADAILARDYLIWTWDIHVALLARGTRQPQSVRQEGLMSLGKLVSLTLCNVSCDFGFGEDSIHCVVHNVWSWDNLARG